jgi:MtN3 and saliva related transmembrane protein
MEWTTEWIGIAAGALTTCAFFPQVVKTVRSRSTGDLSWAWLVMMTTGVFLWLIYGYYVGSPSVFFANVITFFSLFALLLVKVSASRATQEKFVYSAMENKVAGTGCGCGRCESQSCPRFLQYQEEKFSEKG